MPACDGDCVRDAHAHDRARQLSLLVLTRSLVARNVRVGRERILRFQLTMAVQPSAVLLLSPTAERMDPVLKRFSERS